MMYLQPTGVAADLASKQTLEHWNESSIHPPESSNLGLTSYQPTLDASGNYVNDVVRYFRHTTRLETVKLSYDV